MYAHTKTNKTNKETLITTQKISAT